MLIGSWTFCFSAALEEEAVRHVTRFFRRAASTRARAQHAAITSAAEIPCQP